VSFGVVRFFKSAEEKAAIADARQRILGAAALLASATPDGARSMAATLASDSSLSVLSDNERRQLQEQAFRSYAQTVLADDHLTADEEDAFDAVTTALQIPDATLTQAGQHREIFMRLVVAQLNDGRLGELSSPRLIAKAGETVHAETSAALLNEVTIRQFQGGSRGVSFKIMKGVRYNVGSFKGQSVVVGTEMQVQDIGGLSITSSRIVFLGEKKTLEFQYAKLVGLEVFNDGVRLQVSNRQTVSLIRVDPGMGPVIAATINAAIQRTL
jgi:hypothetical protein